MFEKGNESTQDRPRLRISSRLEHSRARLALRNQGSDSFIKPEFSRNLLGGSFEHQNPVSDERAVSNVRFRADQLGRNGYNPTAERSSVFVSFLTHSTPALCQQTHLNVAGASIIVQCCQFIRGIWTGAQEN